jgi:hypothetical protein
MLLAIAVTLLIIVAVSLTRTARAGELIIHRPYNNRHNDASGAREDHLE